MLLLWPERYDDSMVWTLCVFMIVFMVHLCLLETSCFYDTSMGHYTWYLVTCHELSHSGSAQVGTARHAVKNALEVTDCYTSLFFLQAAGHPAVDASWLVHSGVRDSIMMGTTLVGNNNQRGHSRPGWTPDCAGQCPPLQLMGTAYGLDLPDAVSDREALIHSHHRCSLLPLPAPVSQRSLCRASMMMTETLHHLRHGRQDNHATNHAR
jgi:hypothetical protein